MTESIKIQNYSIIERTVFKILKYPFFEKDEICFSRYNLGGRAIIVKWLSDKKLIFKVSSHKTLCGARGCGTVYDFPTTYYLAEILEEKLPDTWTEWTGFMTVSKEMICGKKWKEGLQILEKL